MLIQTDFRQTVLRILSKWIKNTHWLTILTCTFEWIEWFGKGTENVWKKQPSMQFATFRHSIRFSAMHPHLLTKPYNKLPFNTIAWLCVQCVCTHEPTSKRVCIGCWAATLQLCSFTNVTGFRCARQVSLSLCWRWCYSADRLLLLLHRISFINWISLSCK